MTSARRLGMIKHCLNWRSTGKMKKSARSKLSWYSIKSLFSFKLCQVFRKTEGDGDCDLQGGGDISVSSGVTLCQKGLVDALYFSLVFIVALSCQCHPYSVWLTLHVLCTYLIAVIVSRSFARPCSCCLIIGKRAAWCRKPGSHT